MCLKHQKCNHELLPLAITSCVVWLLASFNADITEMQEYAMLKCGERPSYATILLPRKSLAAKFEVSSCPRKRCPPLPLGANEVCMRL